MFVTVTSVFLEYQDSEWRINNIFHYKIYRLSLRLYTVTDWLQVKMFTGVANRQIYEFAEYLLWRCL